MTETAHDVILARHGRTALNAEGRLRGLADPDLDPIGVAEARATATALRPLGLTAVLSSPLQRAVTTATIIADASDVAHRVDAAFNDRDYGTWTGHVKADVVRTWGSVDAAPGVEPLARVLDRARTALDEIVRRQPGPLCIVTHDAVIRPLLEAIRHGITATVATGSWSVLRFADGEWRIISVDNTPTPRTDTSA